MISLQIDPATTALVIIDLQRGITSRTVEPYAAADVIARAKQLVDRFRALESTVVLVHVGFSADLKDRLAPPSDAPAPSGPVSPEFSEILPEIGPRDGDLVILKHQWGAFYGTALDLELRRRGIRTIVLAGIATNVGVESTARDAYEHGYAQIFVEDAMSSLVGAAHAATVAYTFPRIGLVRSTADVLAALSDTSA